MIVDLKEIDEVLNIHNLPSRGYVEHLQGNIHKFVYKDFTFPGIRNPPISLSIASQ